MKRSLAVLLILASASHGGESSWVGQKVMARKSGVMVHRAADDRESKTVVNPFPAFLVVKEKEIRLGLDWGSREVWWVNKADMVLVADAPAFFTTQIRTNPGNASAWSYRAAAWKEKGELDNAIKDYTEAIRLDPENAENITRRGWVWMEKQELDNAMKDFTEAIRLDPKSSYGYSTRGECWRRKGELDNAIKDFTEAIRHDPQNGPAFTSRGEVWLVKKEFDRAIKDFNEGIRQNPASAFSYVSRGRAWSTMKDYDKAIKDCDEAIRLEPKEGSNYTERGEVWRASKDYGRAIKDYDEAIRLGPKDFEGFNRKAYLLATCADDKIRDVAKAEELMKTAVQLEPKDAFNEEVQGVIAAARGKFDEAIRHQKTALQDAYYASWEGEKARARLKTYENKKPYREGSIPKKG